MEQTILLVNHDVTLYGANNYMYILFNHLKKNVYGVRIILCEISYSIELFYKYNISYLDVVEYHSNPDLLVKICKYYEPIFIYLNSYNSTFEAIIKNIDRNKIILHSHEIKSNYALNFKFNITPDFVVSDIIAKQYQESQSRPLVQSPFLSNPQEIIKLSKHYIDCSKIKNDFGYIDSQKINICMCGQLRPSKNYKLFIEVAKVFTQHNFIWIGGNESDKEYFANISNIYHIHFVANPYLYFKQIVDYFMLFSIEDPCPYVILENILLGTPIICWENNIFYDHRHELTKNTYVVIPGNINFGSVVNTIKKHVIKKKILPSLYLSESVEYINKYFTTPHTFYKYIMSKYKINVIKKQQCITLNENKKFDLVIQTMVKNEHHILNEWIVHNILLGVDHIYIYDDQSMPSVKITTSNLPEHIIKKITIYTIDEDFYKNFERSRFYEFEIMQKYSKNKQLYFMNYFLKYHKTLTNWCAFIDVDEFFYLKYNTNIKSFITSKNNFDLIYIRWLLFGTSFYIDCPPGLIMSNFKNHSSKYDILGKSIVKLNKISHINHNHLINTTIHIKKFELDHNSDLGSVPIHLNHYYMTSLKTFLMRKLRSEIGMNNGVLRSTQYISKCILDGENNKKSTIKTDKYTNLINQIIGQINYDIVADGQIIDLHNLNSYNNLNNLLICKDLRYVQKREI